MAKTITDTTMRGSGMTFAFDDGSVSEVIFQWDNDKKQFVILGARDDEELNCIKAFLREENINLHVIEGIDLENNSTGGTGSGNIGDLNNLTTTDKTSAVNAINEVNGNIGNLANLTTTDKSNLVNALNEVKAIAEAATSNFQFTQSTPISPWNVNHNLGYRPTVAIYNPGGKEVMAEVLHISANQTMIYFDLPFSGFATFT